MNCRLLSVVVIAALGACQQPAKTCATSTECGTNGVCVDGVCVAGDGGATGGGSAAGGSAAGGRAGGAAGGGMTAGGVAGGMSGGGAGGTAGGPTSGGSGGGVTAGGVAGGMTAGGQVAGGSGGGTTGCVGCQTWQVCNAVSSTCEDGVLTVASPMEGEAFTPSAMVRLGASLMHDGGLLAVSIPVATDFGQTTQVPSGSVSMVAAPSNSRLARLTFGWDAGTALLQTRTIEVRGCDRVMCGEWQSCSGTVDGGLCVNEVTGLTWLAPDGGPYAAGVMMVAAVRVSMRDGGTFNGNVPVTGGALSGVMTNDKTGTLLTPTTHGPFTLTAGWAGGPTAMTTSRVDAVAPVVTVTVETAPTRTTPETDQQAPGAYKRDETAYLKVETNESASFAQTVVVPGGVQVASTLCTSCGDAARCACYAINLANVPFNAVRGQQGYTVSGVRDVYANLAQSADGGIAVTRLRWEAALADGFAVRASPALDSAGRLYVGTVDANNNNGHVYQVGLRGEVVTFLSDAGAVQGLAVSETRTLSGRQEVVYIAANTAAGGDIRARNVDGGTAGISGQNCAAYTTEIGARKTYTAVALFDAGVTGGVMQVGAAGLFNEAVGALGGALCAYLPQNGAAVLSEPTPTISEWAAPEWGGPLASPTNLMAAGFSVYAQQTNREVRRFDWSVPANAAWNSFGAGPAVTSAGTPVSLAATTTGRLFATLTGALHAVVSMDMTGAQQTRQSVSAAGPVVLGPAATAGNVAALMGTGVASPWLRRSETSASANTSFTVQTYATPSVVALATAPVLGAAVDGGSPAMLYTAHSSTVVAQTLANDGTATPLWAGTAFSGPGVSLFGSPTLDCRRTSTGVGTTGPGTFYLVSSDGRIAAVIVDSPKLATDAPWPKWQRTAGNAGNPGFPLNPGCP